MKDRLGPLPPQFSHKRRARSAERNHKRGRKSSKSAQAPEANIAAGHHKPATARIPVHERLGPLPAQAFKKNDLFHKRNRQQVWRHQGYNKGPQQPQAQPLPPLQPIPLSKEPEPEPELTQRSPALAPVDIVESVKFSNPNPKPAVPHHPTVQPFNAEQHRQTWTWTRPTANSSAMEIDEST